MSRGLLILIGILILLVIVIIVVEKPFGGGESQVEVALFPGFDRSAVTNVKITESGEQTELVREGDDWIVKTALGYPADASAVDKMFDEMEEMEKTDLISENPENHGKLQVDDGGVKVVMSNDAGDEVASFFIGKSGPDYISTYVRRADSDNVYLIPRTLKPVFGKGKTGWCDKRVTDVKSDDITEIEIEDSDGLTVLTKSDQGWHMQKPEESDVKEDAVNEILNTVSNLKADDVVIDKSEVELGLDVPAAKVRLKLQDGSRITLSFSEEKDNRRYLKSDAKKQVFQIYKYRADKILKKPADLIKSDEEKDEQESEKAGN